MTTSAGIELAKKLRAHSCGCGGPCGQKTPDYIFEAAAFLEHPVDTGQGVGEVPEPWELEAAAVFMDHVDDDETGSVHRVAAFLRAVASRPPLASVEGADDIETQAWECSNWPKWLHDLVARTNDVADRLDMSSKQATAYAVLSVLAQSGRSSAEPVAVKAQAQCATEGCERPATCEFSRKGVGSYYCPECFGKVLEVVEQSAIPPVGRQEAAPIAGAGEEAVAWQTLDGLRAITKLDLEIVGADKKRADHIRVLYPEPLYSAASLSQLYSRIGELERENTELREKWGDYPTLSARLYDREKAREAEQETCRAAIARAKSAEAKLAELERKYSDQK